MAPRTVRRWVCITYSWRRVRKASDFDLGVLNFDAEGTPTVNYRGRYSRRRAKTTEPRGRATAGGSPSTCTWSTATSILALFRVGGSERPTRLTRFVAAPPTPASRTGARPDGRSPSAATARRLEGNPGSVYTIAVDPVTGLRGRGLCPAIRSTGSRALPWAPASRRTASGWRSTTARPRTDGSPSTRCRQSGGIPTAIVSFANGEPYSASD